MKAGSRTLPALSTAYAAAAYAFLYLPIVVLVVYSFNRDGVGGFPPQHWTLDWYRTLFDDSAMWTAVGNSAIVALSTVVLSMLIGFPAAYALDRYSFPGKAAFQRLVLLPLIVPGVITGISLALADGEQWIPSEPGDGDSRSFHCLDGGCHDGDLCRAGEAGSLTRRSFRGPRSQEDPDPGADCAARFTHLAAGHGAADLHAFDG